MAKKPKANKAGHPFIGKAGGLNYYINDANEITDEDGKHVGTGYQKVLLQQFAPPEPEQPKEVLEEAFPETYEEPREKKRVVRRKKKNTDVEQREAAEKMAAEYKRDVQDLRDEINAISALMREDTALIRQQLTTQQRSITLLTEIAKNISSGGGGGLNVPDVIGKGIGWKGLLAGVLAGGALGAAGGYFLNEYLSSNEEQDAEELVPEQQPQQTPQQTAGIQEAQQRGGEQKTDILTINARELSFNSDKLSFEVNELTIDADKIKTEGRPGAGGGGGGGGSAAPTGSVGGGAATGAAASAFNPNVETPSSSLGLQPGQSVAGGKGAYQGFTGGLSVKEDLEKAETITPGSFAAAPKNGRYDAAAAAALIKQAGGTDEEARILGAISQPESSGNPGAHNDKGADDSYGLWQINLKKDGAKRMQLLGITDPNQLKDPAINAKAALMLLRGQLGAGGGYQHWSTYTNGSYQQHLNQSVAGIKSNVVESTTSPAELMPEQSTGDLFNPNLTKNVASTFQPVPLEKPSVVAEQPKKPNGISIAAPTHPETLKALKEAEMFDESGEQDAAMVRAALSEPRMDLGVQPIINEPSAEDLYKESGSQANAPQLVPPPDRTKGLVPPTPLQKEVPMPPRRPDEFSGVQPSVSGNANEEIPGMVPSGVHPAFMYLFPNQVKAKISIGSH